MRPLLVLVVVMLFAAPGHAALLNAVYFSPPPPTVVAAGVPFSISGYYAFGERMVPLGGATVRLHDASKVVDTTTADLAGRFTLSRTITEVGNYYHRVYAKAQHPTPFQTWTDPFWIRAIGMPPPVLDAVAAQGPHYTDLRLEWTLPPPDPNYPVDSIQVYREVSATKTLLASLGNEATAYKVKETPDVDVLYHIETRNLAGGTWTTLPVRLEVLPPNPPGNLAVARGPSTTTQVTVEWTPTGAGDARFAADEYEIARALPGEAEVMLATLPFDATSYTVEAGYEVAYEYRVRAKNAAGAGPAGTVSFTNPAATPDTVTIAFGPYVACQDRQYVICVTLEPGQTYTYGTRSNYGKPWIRSVFDVGVFEGPLGVPDRRVSIHSRTASYESWDLMLAREYCCGAMTTGPDGTFRGTYTVYDSGQYWPSSGCRWLYFEFVGYHMGAFAPQGPVGYAPPPRDLRICPNASY